MTTKGIAKKRKFYVVWVGFKPGIYESWRECSSQTDRFPGAKYKSFATHEAASTAFSDGPENHWGAAKRESRHSPPPTVAIPNRPPVHSLCVDGAWNGRTGDMEYRGVWNHNQQVAFASDVIRNGTNNIAEFLAVVEGMQLLQSMKRDWPIYTDSVTALAWIRKRQVRSTIFFDKAANPALRKKVVDALKWLKENNPKTQVLKWRTTQWGEIPADYGRK